MGITPLSLFCKPRNLPCCVQVYTNTQGGSLGNLLNSLAAKERAESVASADSLHLHLQVVRTLGNNLGALQSCRCAQGRGRLGLSPRPHAREQPMCAALSACTRLGKVGFA